MLVNLDPCKISKKTCLFDTHTWFDFASQLRIASNPISTLFCFIFSKHHALLLWCVSKSWKMDHAGTSAFTVLLFIFLLVTCQQQGEHRVFSLRDNAVLQKKSKKPKLFNLLPRRSANLLFLISFSSAGIVLGIWHFLQILKDHHCKTTSQGDNLDWRPTSNLAFIRKVIKLIHQLMDFLTTKFQMTYIPTLTDWLSASTRLLDLSTALTQLTMQYVLCNTA